MEKPSFTPAGVEQVLQGLYAQSNQIIEEEAKALRADLRNWLAQHFELNPHQQEFINKLHNDAIAHYAHLGAFAINNRLPVTLAVAPKDEDDEQGKIVYTDTNVTPVANGTGSYTTTGGLTYHIRY